MKVEPLGLNIDVQRNLESRLHLNGDDTKAVAYSVQSGTNNSMMERTIWDNLFQEDGISAVRILQIANGQGIPIYQIRQDNVSQIIPSLQVDTAVKSEIQDLISAGRTVTIPRQTISYNGWLGIGYIALDPVTGAGGYIIEGGSAGGDTTGSWALGRASAALLALVNVLRSQELISVSSTLISLGRIAGYLGIAVNTMDNYFKVQDANLSPEAKEMLSVLVIGMGVILALLPTLSLLGPYGIVVGFLLASTLSLFFNQMVPLIIQTAETLENRK